MNEAADFVRLRFIGGRFSASAGGLPVDALPEIASYGELILAVARAEYLKRHPNRKRIPKKFVERLNLRLSGFEYASIGATLVRQDVEPSLFDDEFQIAQERVEGMFRRVAAGEDPILASLPPSATGPLRIFGRTLAENEQIEFLRPGAQPGEGPTYSQEHRRRLLQFFQMDLDEPIEAVVRVVGLTTEPDNRATFRFDSGPRIEVPCPMGYFEVLRDALDPDGEGDRFLLQGVAQRDVNRAVKAVSRIDMLDNIEADLVGFALARGFIATLSEADLDHIDFEIPTQSIVTATDLLKALEEDRQPPPTISSITAEAAIRFEWHSDHLVASVDIETDGMIEFVATRKGTKSTIVTYHTLAEFESRLAEVAALL